MRIFVASLVTAIALFFFGFVWWGLLMPVVRPASVIADQGMIEKMTASLDESALYFYPDYAEAEGDSAGPVAILFFNREAPSMSAMMGMGIGHMFVTALLVSLFVSFVPLRSFAERLTFVVCLGLFVAVWADGGNMIWWRHPPLWTAFHFGYDALSWLLAGAIIAAIVRPCPRNEASEDGAPGEKAG